jgi:hypothetical protein
MSLNTTVPTNVDDTYAVPSLPVENASNKEDKANKGIANGYAPLDANAKVPSANIPVIDVSGQIATHNSATTSVHGIANTANLVLTTDARLSDTRDPKAHTHAISDVTDLQTTLDGKQNAGSYASATHSHGNIANDGKVIVPYGGIISATGVDAGSFSDGTFPMIQGAGSGGVITIASGVISVISAGSGYVDGLATKAGGSRYNLVTQATQNASTNLPLITTTDGAITAGSFGTTPNSFCQGNDSRLSDPRTPTSHTHAPSEITGTAVVTSDLSTHSATTTSVHGITDSSQLAYKGEASNLFHRNIFGWPSNSMASQKGTRQSFYTPTTSPVFFDGTEGWSSSSRPIYYVPVFIKNSASGSFTLRVPVKNYSGTISSALFSADTYVGTGHMALVKDLGTTTALPEDESCYIISSSFTVSRGWHFVALYFDADPLGKIWRSTYDPSSVHFAEHLFDALPRSYNDFDSTEKRRRIASVIRRVDASPTWPPSTSSAPKIINNVESPTARLVYQLNNPDGTVAVSNTSQIRPSYMDPILDFATNGTSPTRVNDGGPTSPAILSTASPSTQGGYNLLASAKSGAIDLANSTYFSFPITPLSAGLTITAVQLSSRSTSTGPTGVTIRIESNNNATSASAPSVVPTTSAWSSVTFSGSISLVGTCNLKVYGYGGTGTTSSGNWRIDALEARGTFKVPATPANWTGQDASSHFFAFSEVVPFFHWGFNSLTTIGTVNPSLQGV